MVIKCIFGKVFFSRFSNAVSSVRITGGKGNGVQLDPAGIQGGYSQLIKFELSFVSPINLYHRYLPSWVQKMLHCNEKKQRVSFLRLNKK